MRLAVAALAALMPAQAFAGLVVSPAVTVPEPATLAILAAAVGGLALVRTLRGPRR